MLKVCGRLSSPLQGLGKLSWPVSVYPRLVPPFELSLEDLNVSDSRAALVADRSKTIKLFFDFLIAAVGHLHRMSPEAELSDN